MTPSFVTRSVALLGTFLCVSAVAQARYCIGGDLDHMTQSQKTACSAKLQAVKAAAAALHAPDDWHFVVVCGEQGWKNYVNYAADSQANLLDAVADTNLEQHETFLRGDRLDIINLRSLQRAVAHEVAGIVLRSKDETAINHQMNLWINQGTEQAGI